eukprot:6387703-Prymnesium_polylepis.1
MRWSLQAGAAAIPRSRTPAQMDANLRLFSRGWARVLGAPHATAVLDALDANQSLYGLHDTFVHDRIR